MVNVKVKPGRRDIVIGRFWLHIIFSFLLYYPILARMIAGVIGGFGYGGFLVFRTIMPGGFGDLFLDHPTVAGLLFGLFSITAIVVGALSMEIHSVARKLITFPLFLLNLLSAMIYFYSAL